jgi:hypothetical protein
MYVAFDNDHYAFNHEEIVQLNKDARIMGIGVTLDSKLKFDWHINDINVVGCL